jgi:hypothetical protein
MVQASRQVHLTFSRLSARPSFAAAENVDFIAAKKVKDPHYYSQSIGPCPLFNPWLGHPDFTKFFDGVESYTLVPPERCYILLSLARSAGNLPVTSQSAEFGRAELRCCWHVF